MADFCHLSDIELVDSCRCTLRQQNHSGSQQVLPILPTDWLAGCIDHSRGMCSDTPEYRVCFPSLDQQYRLEQQCYLFHYRLGQPFV